MPKLTMYSLRHTAASLALRAGVNVKVTSAVLGHSRVGLTLDIYSHLIDSQQDQVAGRMQAMLGDVAPVEDLPGVLRALADAVATGEMEPVVLENLGRLLSGFVMTHGLAGVQERLDGVG